MDSDFYNSTMGRGESQLVITDAYAKNPTDHTLSSLVDSLNGIGVKPKEMASILQAMKEAGALIATIEVI